MKSLCVGAAIVLMATAGFFAYYHLVFREDYVLPDGYRGWVAIDVSPECPPLAYKRPWVYDIDAYGKLCTSDLPYAGWKHERFRYKTASTWLDHSKWIHGETGLGEEKRGGKVLRRPRFFFVGSQEEFDRAPDPSTVP